MALRAVTEHPKFANLKSRLKLPKGPALGYLECIWHFTGKFAPQGNIGKYSDSEIEAWAEWDGEPGALIAALVTCGWLELNESFRLVVHDWSQYADDIVQTTLARSRLVFWDGSLPRTGRLNQRERDSFRVWAEAASDKNDIAADKISHNSAKSQPKSATKSATGQTNTDTYEQVRTLNTEITDFGGSPTKSATAPKPVLKPVLKPAPVLKPEGALRDDFPVEFGELEEAWERHHKHKSDEPRDLVFQLVWNMNGDFDPEKFKDRHRKYCAFWDGKGWQYCSLSFLGWIRAGMPFPPPPETVRKSRTLEALDG